MPTRSVVILDREAIRRELRRTKLTQAELARRAGLRKATVTEVLRGRPTSADVIHRIALALSLAEPRA